MQVYRHMDIGSAKIRPEEMHGVPHHLVDCLGTDAHNLDARAPDYAAAKRAIEEAGFGENFAGIQENMRLVLENKPVPREKTKPVKKFLGRYY